MKCEWVQENILLFIYNELPDDARSLAMTGRRVLRG